VGDPAEANWLEKRARRVQKRFAETFWDEERGCLYDVIDGEGHPDAALRPNQVIALGLPFQLLPKPRATRVLKLVEEHLYTPVGLRTLAPGEPGYTPTCEGDDDARERAAHQGTVWTWLLGPFFTALVRIHGAPGRRKARRMMEALRPWLAEGGVGSLSGRYDAEPPHTPRGSIAHAWSVAEVLRAWADDLQEESAPPLEPQGPPQRSRRSRPKKGDR
jgi:glycogen debranching enzyme